MSAEKIDNSDAKQLKDLYDSLYSLIVYCGEVKGSVWKDLDNWAIAHEVEFQLKSAFEMLRKHLAEKLNTLEGDGGKDEVL